VGWLGFCRSMGSEGRDGYILFFEGILETVQNTYVFYTLRECLALNGIAKSWNIIAIPTN
jgi:hypothetical protein